MDFDYNQQQERRFEAFNGVQEEEEEEEAQGYYDEFGQQQPHQQQQQQEEDEDEEGIGSAGNERQLRDFSSSSSSSGKLFVGGVSWETTRETFADYFSKYGELSDAVIMTDRHSGRPRGFGFVTFADPVVAERVLEEEHVIDGRTVEVKRTVPREDMEVKGVTRTKKIFVGGIPPSLTEDELKEYFSLYGGIVEQQIMLDHKTGRSRGFGFVTFETEEAVERIFAEGKTHELGGKQVEIKKAEPKRPGGDYGAATKSYGGFNTGIGGYGAGRSSGGRHSEKMGRGYSGGGGGGYGGYNGYGAYGGGYAGNPQSFYGGYAGYGYGFGFAGPMNMMYGAGGYQGSGAAGYQGSGYGTPSGYGGIGGYAGGKGYGKMGDGSSFGGGKGYGNAGAVNGGYGAGIGYGGNTNGVGAPTGRYHPYRK